MGGAAKHKFAVLVAADSSARGLDVTKAALAFPWPEATTVRGVVARDDTGVTAWSETVLAALDQPARRRAAQVERILRTRWPEAAVDVSDEAPVPAILRRAREASVVVVGSNAGRIGAWLLGSVSRAIVRSAPCSVLVVKGKPRGVRHLVLAVDGSLNARHAVAVVAKLAVPSGSHVTVVRMTERVRKPMVGMLPARMRTTLAAEMAALHKERLRQARSSVTIAAHALQAAGWSVREVVTTGVAVRNLVPVAQGLGADVLVVGARGISGIRRVLLGSVAEAVLNQAPMSVLVVR